MPGGVWTRRRARAVALGTLHPHAASVLTFYERVLGLQEATALTVETSAWLPSDVDRQGIPVPVDRLAIGRHVQEFKRFVHAVGDLGAASTEVLAAATRRLAEAPGTTVEDVLTTFVSHTPLDSVAETLTCPPEPLECLSRAFMQPVCEVLATRSDPAETPLTDSAAVGGTPATCPRCGALPQLAVLRDEADVKGRRTLMCSLCSTEWVFPRATCPSCGCTDTEQLHYHTSDPWPHVRVEECRRCQTYLKAIDLRRDGLAVPLVEEIASVELDLWAEESNLRKVQRNLVGL